MHHKEKQQYLNDLIQILTQFQMQSEQDKIIYIHSSVELYQHFQKNSEVFANQKQNFIQFGTQIIPLGQKLAFVQNKTIYKQLIQLFKLIVEQIQYNQYLYTKENIDLKTFYKIVWQQIYEAVNQTDFLQTGFSIECFKILIQTIDTKTLNEEYLNQIKEYYQQVLYPLAQGISQNINIYYEDIFRIICDCLQELIIQIKVENWVNYQELSNLPQLTINLYLAVCNITDNINFEQGKFALLCVINQFIQAINKQTRYANLGAFNQGLQIFAQQWVDLQISIAQTIITAISNAENFDLYSDSDNINKIFELCYHLLDQNNSSQFIHQRAAELLMNNSEILTQKIVQTAINAGITRFNHFQTDDLLVIDALRNAIDVVQRFATYNTQINDLITSQTQEMLNDFLNESVPLNKNDMQQQCKIFAGILLLRRGIPRPQMYTQVNVCILSLKYSMQLHEIVFEEASKLIINVIQEDDYFGRHIHNNDENKLQLGTTYEQVLEKARNNQDCALDIIDLLIQQYMMPDRSNFIYRMLSGILSRPVKRQQIPLPVLIQLLRQSLNLLLDNNNSQMQKAGMVTLIKTILSEEAQADVFQNSIADLLSNDPHFTQIPELISQNNEGGKQFAECCINAINMLLDNIWKPNQTLIYAIVSLFIKILGANISVSQTLFKTLNNIQFSQYSEMNIQIIQPILEGLDYMLQQPNFTLCNAIIDSLTFINNISYIYEMNSIEFDVSTEPIINFGCNLIIKYQNYIQQTQNNNQFTVSHANSILFSGIFILQNILSKINQQSLNENRRYQILEKITPIIKVFYEQPIGSLLQSIQDSETKRMYLLFYSMFYLQYIKLIQLCQDNLIECNQYKQEALCINKSDFIIVVFSAIYAIQDSETSVGFNWRYQLSLSSLIATPLLLELYQLKLQETQYLPQLCMPLLLIAQQLILAQTTSRYSKCPYITFQNLQTQDQEINQQLMLVFENMSSEAINQIIAEGTHPMPFWAGIERTKYSELIFNVGNNQGIRINDNSQYINQLKSLIEKSNIQMSPEWQQYIQVIYKQYQDFLLMSSIFYKD